MELRELTADDHVAYRALSAGAFGGSLAEPGERRERHGVTGLGIDSASLPGGVPGVLAAGASIRHDRITVGGGTVSCGGIGGLAVHPAHRGDGLFRTLLTGVIARCATEDLAWSMLYPSNPAIYRSLGYQVVSEMGAVTIPLVDLQRLPRHPDRRLVPVTEEVMPRLQALYRELTADQNGMLLREPPLFPAGHPGGRWEALLLEDSSGRAHGYVSWTRQSSGDSGLEVHELFGRGREDRVALLRALGSWSTVVEQIRLRIRLEDPVLDVLPGGSFRRDPQHVPLVMMRLIDTAAALAARPAPADLEGTITLEVTDETVPAGTCRSAGRWQLTARDGSLRTRALDPGTADPDSLGVVSLDIHAASLLLIGGRTLDDARRLGLAVHADPAAQRFLDGALAGPRPAVMDAF